MNAVKYILLIIVIVFHVNATSFNISYDLGGSFYSVNKVCRSYLTHNFDLLYTPKELLSFGLVVALDRSFNIDYFKKGIENGYGAAVCLNFMESDKSKIQISCKYIYFGHIEQKTIVNGKVINSIDLTLQKLILGYGISLNLNRLFGVKFGYNIFLYKSGNKFLDQFYELQGFYSGLEYNIKINHSTKAAL
jgi:hypothetical protein